MWEYNRMFGRRIHSKRVDDVSNTQWMQSVSGSKEGDKHEEDADEDVKLGKTMRIKSSWMMRANVL